MTIEAVKYSENLQDFLDKLKVSRVEQILFDIDKEPAFEKAKLTFDFKYCHSIKVVTNSGSFIVHTSMTDSGSDTFWITTKTLDDKEYDSSLLINMSVKTVLTSSGRDNLPFKIELDFGTGKVFIYAADIYEEADETIDCKINDEMILVFEDQHNAEEFEKMTNYR